jgi:Uma2 family endonuclease
MEDILEDDYIPVGIVPTFKVVHNYTYADYVSWNDGVRRELIDGEAYEMAAPTGRHQAIAALLYGIFGVYLRGKTFRAMPAPYDVRLFAPLDDAGGAEDKRNDHTTVQPDLSVICDKRKLHKDGCHGAPDLVIEILSEENPAHDTIRKLNLYMRAGVREYWIIDPFERELYVYTPESDKKGRVLYRTKCYGPADKVKVGVLKDLVIDLNEIFNRDESGNIIEGGRP